MAETFTLGSHNTKPSKEAYDRVLAEWWAGGRKLFDRANAPGDLTINELVAQFWTHVESYYRHPDGAPTREVSLYRDALRPLLQLYGHSQSREFGPLALEAVRNAMIEKGWSRTTINKAVCRIRQAFKWAVSKELIKPDVHQALASLAGLRAGRSAAKESAPVQPVSDEVVDETLKFMPRTIAAMVQVQRLTGARPGEICFMKVGDIDRTPRPDGVWSYVPASHKTAFRGHHRIIPIGPRAQKILLPFLKMDRAAYCFSPEESERERRAALSAQRKTPLQYGNRTGTNRKQTPKWKPRDHYDVDSYGAGAKPVSKECD